ncbi:hypothetical protein IWW54_004653, partial [Coemansia sp. RSA 2705]
MDIVLTEDPFVKRLEKDARDKINEDLFKTMVYFKTGDTAEAKRALLPYASDLKRTGSDERIRIDGALCSCANALSSDNKLRPDYRDIILITEAKWYREQDEAYDQLIRYTRQVYANQPNRRFA